MHYQMGSEVPAPEGYYEPDPISGSLMSAHTGAGTPANVRFRVRDAFASMVHSGNRQLEPSSRDAIRATLRAPLTVSLAATGTESGGGANKNERTCSWCYHLCLSSCSQASDFP
ncbi:unnamed protein product [Caretta caretta]